MKIVSTAEMRKMEQAADAGGLSYAMMMENAGRAVAEATQALLTGRDHPFVFVLVGPGNNGGDGLVAARHLRAAGAQVVAYCCKRKVEGDAVAEAAIAAGVTLLQAQDDEDRGALRRHLAEADVVLDALLGTGVARPIEGEMKAVLEVAGEVIRQRRVASQRPEERPLFTDLMALPEPGKVRKGTLVWPQVVAVDCPSGLNCDTGALDPVALTADLTVTFAYAKWGHFLFPGAGACGRLLVADIGIPPSLAAEVRVEVATPDLVRPWLPRRPADAHKGTFGRALIVAGSANFTGAAYLAGAAAYRVGAGLVTMGVARSLHPILAAALHETTWLLLPHDMGVLAPDAARLVREKASDYRAMLLGPGLGQEKPTVEFVRQLLEPKDGTAPRLGFQAILAAEPEPTEGQGPPRLPPLVLDADGLNILAGMEGWPRRVPPGSVLTPHPGEMARLCGLKTAEVEADRLGLARTKAAEWNQIVVLKGAHTICAAPDGHAVIQPFANPTLATAGSGDVLAGAIVGLLAQGCEPFQAAVVGAYLHGMAGEAMRRAVGEAGGVAGDLLPRLPEVLRALREGF
jgi:hydroxyethylthiazole kinase-like uncharacterized protein yjeF